MYESVFHNTNVDITQKKTVKGDDESKIYDIDIESVDIHSFWF